jgi:hypothetical protein
MKEIDTSPETTNVMKAMMAVQKDIQPVIKSTTNSFYKSKYADLAAVHEMIQPLLAEQELGIFTTPTTVMIDGSQFLHMNTMIYHSSNEWLSFNTLMPLPKVDPQGFGIALTYGRRYIITSLFNITTEDNDGNLPQQSAKKVNPKPVQKDPTEIRKEVVSLGQDVYKDDWDKTKADLVKWASNEKETDINKADYNTLNKIKTGLNKKQQKQTEQTE